MFVQASGISRYFPRHSQVLHRILSKIWTGFLLDGWVGSLWCPDERRQPG
jgi:hypothetical protein